MQINLAPHQLFILKEALRVAAQASDVHPADKDDYEKLSEHLHSEFVNSGERIAAGPAYGCGPTSRPYIEEQYEFDVIIDAVTNKIVTIKALREITRDLSLVAAVSLVQNLPATVKYGVSKADAEDFKKILQDTGATVRLK